MVPAGVRLQCPECTWSVVVTDGLEPDALPPGVNKVVEGTYFCPNCPDIPLKPVASVDVTPKPKTGVGVGMTFEQIAAKCVEIQREAAELGDELKEAKEAYNDAKKAHDAKLVALSLAVERLGRVMGGEVIEPDRPLLDLAEQASEDASAARCAATADVDGAAVQCQGVDGHGGPHGHGDLFWGDDPAVLEAALDQARESLRLRLAEFQILVDRESLDAWTHEEFEAVSAYATALETGMAVDMTTRPAVLPDDLPEHVTALHRSLGQVGVVMGLGAICAWTPQQRQEAAEWAAAEVNARDSAERPEHIPAPAGEPERVISKRHAKGAPKRRRSPLTEAEEQALEDEAAALENA